MYYHRDGERKKGQHDLWGPAPKIRIIHTKKEPRHTAPALCAQNTKSRNLLWSHVHRHHTSFMMHSIPADSSLALTLSALSFPVSGLLNAPACIFCIPPSNLR